MPWSYQIDSFSIGCTLIKLAAERPLSFRSNSTSECLAAIEQAIGLFPSGYAKEVERTRLDTFHNDTPMKIYFEPQGGKMQTGERDAAKRCVGNTYNVTVR